MDQLDIAVVSSPVTAVPADAGGAQAFLVDLATGLSRRGHRVSLYCVDGSEAPGVDLVTVPPPADAEEALVVPGGPPPDPAPGVAAAIGAMFSRLRSRGPDVVSQHAFDREAFDLAQGLPFPVLHTLHLPPVVPALVNAARRVPPERLATVSEATMSAWAASGVRIGRLLRNGVPDLAVERGSIEPVALIAGRLSPEKGVEQGVAAALLAGLRPLVVGAAYDRDYQPNLSGAEVLAPLPRGELRRLMARCAVTLAPLRWEEPFGLVYAEAQLAGCPVAGFRRGALPEVVPEGVGGHLVPADDVPALARAARSALNLDRDRVWESALGRFGMEPVLDAYERALRAVAR